MFGLKIEAGELSGSIATDPGIAMHVERVGVAGVVGEIKPNASAITWRAYKDWLPLTDGDQDRRDGQGARDQRDEDRPMSLWSALALDPPAEPTKREMDALKARARLRRAEHDRFIATLDGLDPSSAEQDAHRALQLRYFAAIIRVDLMRAGWKPTET
jgi:hypothetical protein